MCSSDLVRGPLTIAASLVAEHRLQTRRLTGLAAPRHVGSSQTRTRTRVPCIGRQILNHYATRKAPDVQSFQGQGCVCRAAGPCPLHVHCNFHSLYDPTRSLPSPLLSRTTPTSLLPWTPPTPGSQAALLPAAHSANAGSLQDLPSFLGSGLLSASPPSCLHTPLLMA